MKHARCWGWAWPVGLSFVLLACAAAQRHANDASHTQAEERVSLGSDAPALFLGPSLTAQAIGFLASDVRLEIAGESAQGRVPVRIRGPLMVRGYVPETQLAMHVQRHGQLRGTPVYFGPNDLAVALGPSEAPGRLRVRAVPQVPGQALPAYEGTFPAVGLAPSPAPDPEALPAGEARQLPAGSGLSLYDKPEGTKLVEFQAHDGPLALRVLSAKGGWSAVRVGTGPYLVGYTNAALEPAAGALAARPEPRQRGAVPALLARHSGELFRVKPGAAISFGKIVIAKLRDPGYARVLRRYPGGEVDALVAVDGAVTVRGLLHASDLTPASDALSQTTR
jgi:hypothetical protein